MKMTVDLVEDILNALIRAAKKHKGVIEKLHIVQDEILATEIEIRFVIREKTDRELSEG